MITVARNPQFTRRRSERGLTLIEALVAITIFTVVFLVALTLHQTATSSYLRTDSAVIQQQNIRFTMDRMSETLRDAGAGHNMLGNRKVADEQIEGAWEGAVFVRGDFDGQRETALETTYPIVTTGNDEIVGYVLRKFHPDTGADMNTQTLSLKMDLLPATGRNAVFTSNASIAGEETASVSVAAYTLAQQNVPPDPYSPTAPPYQLARVTFDALGVAQYETVATNIKQLKFGYYPATGTTAVAVADSGADNERDKRALVRKIEVSLVGLSDREDLQYKPGYREFTLAQTILGVNLGIVGSKHNKVPAVSLPIPASITACNGHCRHHLVRWAAATGVSVYRLEISAPDQGGLGTYLATADVAGLEYSFKEPDADIAAGVFRSFTFRVAATSGITIGTYTSTVARTSTDDSASIPSVPLNVLAVGSTTEYAMDVTWNAVTDNTGAVTDTARCISAGSVTGGSAPPSPWNLKAIDLSNSKIYRARSTGSNSGDATVDVSTQKIGALENAVSNTAFRDRTAAPCSPYFYRVKACDLCATTSDYSAIMSTPVTFPAPNGVTPAKPPSAPTVVGAVGSNGTNYTVQLQWAPVTFASDGKPAAVAHYALERYLKVGAAGSYALDATYNIYEGLVGPVDTPLEVVSGQAAYYRYYVRGVYDCGSPAIGPQSDPYDLACTPPVANTVTITKPVYNDMYTRPSEPVVALELTTTGTGWTSSQIMIKDLNGNQVMAPVTLTAAPAANKYTFTGWLIPDSVPDGVYVVSATAMVGSCRATAPDVTFSIETTVCGQRIVQANLEPDNGQKATEMQFKIENTCPNNAVFNKLTLFWTGVKNTPAASAVKVTRINNTTTTFYNNSTGSASGGLITLTSSVTLLPGTVLAPSVSPLFTFSFNDNFTSDADKDSPQGQFTSILANITSPSLTTEQLVDGAPIP